MCEGDDGGDTKRYGGQNNDVLRLQRRRRRIKAKKRSELIAKDEQSKGYGLYTLKSRDSLQYPPLQGEVHRARALLIHPKNRNSTSNRTKNR